jgi:spore coat protein U-like protein
VQGGATVRCASRLALLIAAAVCPIAGQAGCALNVVGLNFGAYDIFDTQDVSITTNVGVTCDTDTSFEISLSAGSGSFASRTLVNGANLLSYNLYVDPAHLTIWGDGSPGTATVSSSGTSRNFTVYGRIPARQNAFVGSYSDTITVTITF